MRISAPTRAATPFYDRNPSSIVTFSSNNTNISPHGNTNRASYTVPSFRNAMMAAVCNTMHRRTVATTAAETQLVTNSTICGYDLRDLNNTLDAFTRLAISSQGLMKAGSVQNVVTHDLSTGGTMDYYYNAEIIEYDA